MASLTNERRQELVQALSLRAERAEDNDPRVILPIQEHLRAFEPEVVLVVGDRGAGKTQLKRALETPEVRDALLRVAPGIRAPTGRMEWFQAWPLGTDGPDSNAWSRFHESTTHPREDGVGVWLAYLLRTMRGRLHPDDRDRCSAVLDAQGVDAAAVLSTYRSCGVAVTAALDALDRELAAKDEWYFVAYDELDTVVIEDWKAMGFVIGSLVSFWAAYSRRWRRIRPKIFLRSDFYKHHRDVAGADVAKIAGNRVELQWSDKNLYGALIKHILNKKDGDGDHSLREYFARAVKDSSDDPVLGRIPRLGKAIDAKPFVDRLISEFMGANKGKGLAFRWILDHLRDGNGSALPRSLVMLVEHAAEKERDHPRATGAHLLHHTSVRNALDAVSEAYVEQAESHELRWLKGLASRLQKDRAVPWHRSELLELLKADFDGTWSSNGDARPPGASAEELVTNLVALGVLRQRTNDTFDVPDLYLHGLGLTRKGGVAKK